jgi:mono/diheme cytochrome c family protein
VSGYVANVMPQNFGERLTYQDMADITAYVMSFDS